MRLVFLKDLSKRLFALNGELNDSVYRIFGRNQARHAEILSEFYEIDTISDVSVVRDFRRRISDNNDIFYTTNANISNSSIYGIWESLFPGTDRSELYKTPAVEHGLIFSEDIFTDLRYTARASSITFGDYRKKIIRRYKDTPTFCVGPYILYAQSYYNEEKLSQLKAELGKTLLVFPAHSTDASQVSQNDIEFVEKIKREAARFDSVLVNSFWWNINDPLVRMLESEGFRIVTAGFRDDLRFLSRLRSIIALSDVAVGDSVGTHIGYTLSLGVPFKFLDTSTIVEVSDAREGAHQAAVEERKNLLRTAFAAVSGEDVNSQIEICEPYWGFSHVKTREQLQIILDITKQIVARGNGWVSRYGTCARDLISDYEAEGKWESAKMLREAMA